MPYPKRLIEVDLPIRRISAHARREKSIRHGHISTLHIWWARRPLAACRAVLCASLWPDPADENCPKEFVEFAEKEMLKWSNPNHLQLLSSESYAHFVKLNHDKKLVYKKTFLRQLLLDFIADFANWDNTNKDEFLASSRALTQNAHIVLGGEVGTVPLVFDPFAGGGSIPLEALRIGAEAFASDLNPIPVLLNRVILEYIPIKRNTIANEIKEWGGWVSQEAKRKLAHYYPTDKDDSIPITYLWARSIQCEGPGCGFRIPLIRTTKLSDQKFVKIIENKDDKSFKLFVTSDQHEASLPTVSAGKAICPRGNCRFITSAKSVKLQLAKKHGGANDAQLLAVVLNKNGKRDFRSPIIEDYEPIKSSEKFVDTFKDFFPREEINEIRPYKDTRGLSAVTRIGIKKFEDAYSYRQLVSLKIFSDILQDLCQKVKNKEVDIGVYACLGLAYGKLIHQNCSLSRWQNNRNTVAGAFGKQALQITWDFAETCPVSSGPGSWSNSIDWIIRFINENINVSGSGTSVRSTAKSVPLPLDSASALITDPPYFAAIPYSDLSMFFYVWLRKIFIAIYPDLFSSETIDQSEEAIVTNANLGPGGMQKNADFFKNEMTLSLSKAREILSPSGIGVVVFADTKTESWEAILNSVITANWVITGSWPIDTELQGRTQARNSASLQSSIHLVCRPREDKEGSLIQNLTGDWRDVQEELPKRIHEWMPRLASEGIAGADAIFACLGPALEIFSRYSKVVQAGSEREISLREYLEKVWSAVSQEALNMVFSGGDAQGMEEDARLTAMWLWTITAGTNGGANEANEEDEDEDDTPNNSKLFGGFTLEYDTARKIAQGLGVDLEELKTLVEVKGDKARLLPVQERMDRLFGNENLQKQTIKKKKKAQLSFSFENMEPEQETRYEMPELRVEQTGKTVLDRLHQTMLLFSAGRTEALKRFLVEDGVGKDDRFWKLAQALTALYPKDTDERRWVEAVQTYKKSLGF